MLTKENTKLTLSEIKECEEDLLSKVDELLCELNMRNLLNAIEQGNVAMEMTNWKRKMSDTISGFEKLINIMVSEREVENGNKC